ncbi:pseudouridine synthase [Maribacter sp. ACAM166]|uniref:pseudouridine synthase n=1 Tax=Maribacter sp. ACAM166 TaxID=2508996 RepID=UPI0010FDA6AA|nr:pseudouridine synthase [Maribacter sp. ACAM166]TLP79224.1 pseudouridine synthase [Maribacter sp. ACAM166]
MIDASIKIKHYHFKVYKPFGLLSQMSSGEDRQLRKKRFLSELYDFPEGIMPVGRLDEKSEGLLLMTTDGKLSDTINSAGIEKEYLVQLDGLITSHGIEQLSKGVSIGVFGKKYTTKPCLVKPLENAPALPKADTSLRIGRHRPTSWISITVTEGKFRQIRKMTAAVGFPTLRLVRIRVGEIKLDKLIPGVVEPTQLNRE